MAAAARSGCSTVARWAASGRRTSSECGIRSQISTDMGSGVDGSSAPQMTRVGAVMVWIWSRRSISPIAALQPA